MTNAERETAPVNAKINSLGEVVDMSDEEIAAYAAAYDGPGDPEEYCRVYCGVHKRAKEYGFHYDQEHPCFYCELFC